MRLPRRGCTGNARPGIVRGQWGMDLFAGHLFVFWGVELTAARSCLGPRVEELPTCQNTLDARAPPFKMTCGPTVVISVLAF
jgi:hypothetical protein